MDIYREEILEHWQNPLNFGVMDGADLVVEQVNPLCGDEVTFFFKFEKKGNPKSAFRLETRSRRAIRNPKNGKWKIKEVTFTGSGCAISMASASMLSEAIKGKPVSQLGKITGHDVLDLIGGSVAPARLKCAFLALEAIRQLADKSEARSAKYETNSNVKNSKF